MERKDGILDLEVFSRGLLHARRGEGKGRDTIPYHKPKIETNRQRFINAYFPLSLAEKEKRKENPIPIPLKTRPRKGGNFVGVWKQTLV